MCKKGDTLDIITLSTTNPRHSSPPSQEEIVTLFFFCFIAPLFCGRIIIRLLVTRYLRLCKFVYRGENDGKHHLSSSSSSSSSSYYFVFILPQKIIGDVLFVFSILCVTNDVSTLSLIATGQHLCVDGCVTLNKHRRRKKTKKNQK